MSERPEPGSRVLLRWRKWDGSAHWEHDAIFLGTDVHGDWIGQGRGWRTERPGWKIDDFGPVVMVIPPGGDHVISRFPVGGAGDTDVYVDLAWDARWASAEEITAIDMDLDVIRLRDDAVPYVPGRTNWIADKDEWDEHRVSLAYPDEVVATLPGLADEILRAVIAREAPYDAETLGRWARVLAEFT